MKWAPLIFQNLARNKVRTGLITICVAIAFAIYGVLGAFLDSFQLKGQIDAADRLMVTNRVNFSQSLPISYANQISRVPGVSGVSHVRWAMAHYKDPKDVIPLIMIDAESYLPMFPKIKLTPAGRQAFMTTRNGLLVGRQRAQALGWKEGDTVNLTTLADVRTDGSRNWNFVVSAIYTSESEAEEQGIAAHYTYFNEGLFNTRDSVNWFILKVDDPATNDKIAAKIDSIFANSAAETKTQSESAFGRAMLDQLGNITLIVRLVVGAAFLVILFIVGNTMVHAINQRTREIGILKTLGFPTLLIVSTVAMESLIVAAVGGTIGLTFASFIIAAIAGPMATTIPGLSLSFSIAAGGVLLIALLSLITGAGPAFIAYRLKIIDALNRR